MALTATLAGILENAASRAREVLMNEVLRDIVATKTVHAIDGKRLEHVAGITPDEGELLARLIRELKPSVSLEVGLAYGTSALYICDALAEVEAKKHYIVDPNQSSEW